MPSSQSQKYLFDVPTNGRIAQVCAQIIRAVKADKPGLTNAALAVAIGAKDKGVVDRLENAETDKVPASLITTIGAAFGSAYIQPYMELMGLTAVPKRCEEAVQALPSLTALVAKIAAAAGNGEGISHVALGRMLPELRAAEGVIAALRAKAGEMAA